jgi:hypothetical protein
MYGLLALQGMAGNRAVTGLVTNQPTFVQRDPQAEPPVDFAIFVGDGRHKPDDAEYAAAIGRKDAERLRAAGTLSTEDRQEINAKLKYFKGAGYDAYVAQVKPALVEVTSEEIDMSEEAAKTDEAFTPAQLDLIGQAANVNVLFSTIKDLRLERIRTWSETAKLEEPKPLRKALEIAVTVAAAATGGVVGTLIAKNLTGLAQEFVKAGGGELIEKVGGDLFQFAMNDAGASLQKGAMEAFQRRDLVIEPALAAQSGDLLGVYTEAMRLQTIAETMEQQEEFNLNAGTTHRSLPLLLKNLALKVIYLRLMTQPEVFQRELTVGFLRLMDENHVAKVANEDYGGDRQRAWREDEDLHEVEERMGNLLVLPARYTTLSKWYAPRLDFGDFRAQATEVNTRTLQKLAGTPVKDLPLTLAFRYWVENPIYRILKGDWVQAWFTRDPGGNVWLDEDLEEGAMEWLASYHSGIDRMLTDEERAKYAPLGAKKLYEATKNKLLVNVSNSDLL